MHDREHEEPTAEQIAEKLADALLRPLQDVGTMLAKEIDALKARVDELEQRIAEAGRRALFHAEQARLHAGGGRPETTLADLGRALLFDPETPDRQEDG